MHFSDLIEWEPYEDRGIYDERPILKQEIIAASLVETSTVSFTLDVLEGVIGLLNDQADKWISKERTYLLHTKDIHYLYTTYTKLGHRSQLFLPRLRFTDWESFSRRFRDAQNDLDLKIMGQPELDWFNEPTEIVRNAIESGWTAEFYVSIDSNVASSWTDVRSALSSMRKAFTIAQSPDEYANVGRNAVSVIEKLSDILWDSGKYRMPDHVDDGRDKTKNRLETVARAEFAGSKNEAIRGLAIKSIAFAHDVKHSRTPRRYEAAIAANTALFMVDVFWHATQRAKSESLIFAESSSDFA